jgi:replicative DNA helicase
VKSFLKALATNRNLYQRAKEEGLSFRWFSSKEEKRFIQFLDFLYNSSTNGNLNNIDNLMTYLADTHISDDDERTKFLLFVDQVLSSQVSEDFETTLALVKERYLSKLLSTSLRKAVYYLKEGDLNRALESVQNVVLLAPDTNHQRVVNMFSKHVYEAVFKNVTGIKTGYSVIDNATKGFRPGELIIIVSGFAEGKSTLLLNIAYNVFTSGYNVTYFSIEMPYVQVARRFYSLCTGIPYSKIKSNDLSPSEKKKIEERISKMENLPNKFYIVDCPECTVSYLDSKLVSLHPKPDFVVIDYLTIIKSDTSFKSLWESINTITVKVRSLARKYNVPILTAAQVRREAIERDREFYEAQDIALAFSMIQHADIVFSIRIDDPDVLQVAPICLLKCKFLKDRDGERSVFSLRADFSIFKISDITISV